MLTKSAINKTIKEIETNNTEQELLNLKITTPTEEDFKNAWTDEYGAKYSQDRKRLLKGPNNLEEYTILQGTTVICDGAFVGCKSLKQINIPNSVTHIGDYAF
ncbi:MAG: leucine-rich repeat protein [Bacteroidales bacterium]|nr:leucine-rich repeat protein [Bacteroidales bacterium]